MNILNVRHQQKHDIPANWEKSNLIPLAGEIIVYDDRYIDSDYNEVLVATAIRYKIGDGVSLVKDLPFADASELARKVKELTKRIDELEAVSHSELTPVDGTITIATNADGDKQIGVAISPNEGNALVAVENGLFVPTAVIPRYTLEKQETAEAGYLASYRLKQTLGEEVSYVGESINIARDLVLQSATLEVVTEKDIPYPGANTGDPYIKMVFNSTEAANIYIPVKDLVDVPVAGIGIEIIDNKISVKLAPDTHGLVAVNGALTLKLATKDSDGAMSKEDKRTIEAIPFVYEARKFEISGTPAGTLVEYSDREIRVMCPKDTVFAQQAVGNNGNPNMYYMSFKAYAPKGAASFKEGDRGVIIDEMHTFDGPASGIDRFGRRYSICWLALASYNSKTDTWTYFGATSNESKYIGWDYCVEWYDENNIKLGYDSVRINLSNEECHYINKPYYLAKYATVEDITDIKKSFDEFTIWGEI